VLGVKHAVCRGIDIAKEIHEASLVDAQGKLQGRSIRFSNTLTDFYRFMEWLSKDTLEMAMEATGHYWLPLYDFLKGQGYDITVLNPLQTETHRRGADPQD